jgi:hypothetical protein
MNKSVIAASRANPASHDDVLGKSQYLLRLVKVECKSHLPTPAQRVGDREKALPAQSLNDKRECASAEPQERHRHGKRHRVRGHCQDRHGADLPATHQNTLHQGIAALQEKRRSQQPQQMTNGRRLEQRGQEE